MFGGFPEALNRFGGAGHNAVSTHLHGGFTPWVSDGGPMAWFTPNGTSAGTTLAIAASNVSFSLGNGLVGLTQGQGVLILSGTGLASSDSQAS